MDKNIVNFKSIVGGWLDMEVYDNVLKKIRKMRVSYLQPFFDDLLMACKFLLSDITGIYEVEIDQEGFDANIKFYKHSSEIITLEINEDFFEDEKDENGYFPDMTTPTNISYYNIPIKDFVENIVILIDRHKEEYNEGFAYSPADRLDEKLESQVKRMYYDKYLSGGEKCVN